MVERPVSDLADAPSRLRSRSALQARKSHLTRTRILAGLIECVEQGGLTAASTTRIAAAAGVSVGAVQHHFATKDELLAALLDESANRLAACFSSTDFDRMVGESLQTRCDTFVDRAWAHYGSSFFRVAQQVLSTKPARRDHRREQALVRSAEIAEQIWLKAVGEVPIAKTTQREIRRFALATLNGLSILARYEPGPEYLEPELQCLKTSLVHLLSNSSSDD